MAKIDNVTIESLLEVSPSQLESMTRKDLAQVVTRLRDAGQKRLKRIEKSGERSPAAEYIKRTGGFAKIRGMDIADLRNEYTRIKGFLSSKTGSVKGAKEYTERVSKDVAESLNMSTGELYEKLPPKIQGMMWQLIDKAGGKYRYKYQEYAEQAARAVLETYNPQNYDGSQDTYDAMKEAAFNNFMEAVQAEYEKENVNENTFLSAYFDE